MKKEAFTLAEVLITLGIIGIIAALTIPNIIAGYRKKVVETRLAKLYSSVNKALKMSEVKNSDCKYWEWGDINNHRDADFMENWWKKYLNNYMPYVIFSKKENTPSTGNSGNGGYKVFFKDGSALRIEALPGSYARFMLYPDAKKTDLNSYSSYKIKERPGKDFFMFMIYPTQKCSLVPLAEKNADRSAYINTCLQDYNTMGGSLGGPCAQLILQNGWKIPDDYPIKF